jgi:hypothetical protein
MDQQGLSEGSLRNSHREIHAIRRKPAKADLQSCAVTLLESCSEDTIIRQRIDLERAEPILKRGSFFVLENEGRAEPGFLVFLKDQAAVFLQPRKGSASASTLRLRCSTGLREGGGSILVATLDDVLHTLRLEDVWMWRGQPLYKTETFTKRREKLKEFVEHHWIPDARLLGGIFVKIAHPISLEAFSQKKLPLSNTFSLEFIPDMPGKRRMAFYLEAIAKAAEGHAGLKQIRGGVPAAVASALVPAANTSTKVETREPEKKAQGIRSTVRITPVDKMPDVYTVYGEDGLASGRASVQRFSLSLEIRKKHQETPEAVWAEIEWNPEFNGYEILRLVSS